MLKDALNFFIQQILDMIFPPTCGLCGNIHENWICEKCYRRLELLKINEKSSSRLQRDIK